MKKILLFGGLLLSVYGAKAQTIINEDFEGTAIPSGWTQTTLATDGGWKHGLNTAIQSSSFPIPTHTKMIGTNDDGCNCDKSNDFMTSPSFSLTGITSAVLKFDLLYYEGTYQGASESLKLEVSIDGGTTWTVVQTLTGAGDWRTEIVDLTSYTGNANVKIGFRYNDGAGWTFGAAMDNFNVSVPAALDLATTSINLPTFIGNNQPFTITGNIANYGSQVITSMTLNYSIDNGTPVTQNLTSLNIAAINGQYSYSHSTPYTPTVVGSKTVKVWASNINGAADMNTANDEATGTVMVASQVVPRVTCIEEFTSSTCAPCASLNSTFDPLLATNNANDLANFSNVTAIKYQMNWPSPGNDPSYNPDGVTRQNYYGVNSIPDVFIDGFNQGTDQAAIDAAKSKIAAMNVTATATKGGNLVTVNVNVTPYISIASGTKLYIGIMEKEYDYAASTTSQDQFHHVMRKMIPNGSGITLNNLVDGTPVTQGGSYSFTLAAPGIPAQNSYALWTNMDNLEVIAFVQNVATKEVYQADLAPITTGVSELSNNFSINLFPNPVQNDLVVNIKANKNANANLDIVNAIGQVVYSERIESVPAGENVYHVNTSNLSSGIYFAKVNFGGEVQTIKFTVAK
ncbi:MAG TPA: T9SS type A sorting domain-containing protein [Bacteroidia bacterium]|nr:T9SS type A sorting domain-containing protein [Bacteroidia bacterium]